MKPFCDIKGWFDVFDYNFMVYLPFNSFVNLNDTFDYAFDRQCNEIG